MVNVLCMSEVCTCVNEKCVSVRYWVGVRMMCMSVLSCVGVLCNHVEGYTCSYIYWELFLTAWVSVCQLVASRAQSVQWSHHTGL